MQPFPTGMELSQDAFPGLWAARGGAVLYREVPKAACSALAQVLHLADHGRFFDGDIHDATDGVLKWPFDPALLAPARDGRALVFSAVRNPYARLLSAFRDKVCTEQRDGKPYRHILRQVLAEDFGVDLAGDPVRAFRRFVLFVRDAHLGRLHYWQDRHWTPQAQHLRALPLAGIPYTDLLRVEEFAATLQPLLDRLGLALRAEALPRFNPAPPSDLPLSAWYDDLTIHLMQEIYRWDFDLFGYDRFDPAAPLRPIDLGAVQHRLSDPHPPHWAGLGG